MEHPYVDQRIEIQNYRQYPPMYSEHPCLPHPHHPAGQYATSTGCNHYSTYQPHAHHYPANVSEPSLDRPYFQEMMQQTSAGKKYSFGSYVRQLDCSPIDDPMTPAYSQQVKSPLLDNMVTSGAMSAPNLSTSGSQGPRRRAKSATTTPSGTRRTGKMRQSRNVPDDPEEAEIYFRRLEINRLAQRKARLLQKEKEMKAERYDLLVPKVKMLKPFVDGIRNQAILLESSPLLDEIRQLCLKYAGPEESFNVDKLLNLSHCLNIEYPEALIICQSVQQSPSQTEV